MIAAEPTSAKPPASPGASTSASQPSASTTWSRNTAPANVPRPMIAALISPLAATTPVAAASNGVGGRRPASVEAVGSAVTW